jgi:hypothetical protein
MANLLRSTSTYLPGREALFIEVDLSDYLIDYYIHRQQIAPKTQADHDDALKDLIACLAIHLTVRPSAECHAWTAHLVSSPPYSLFVAGELTQLEDARKAEGYLIGNILTENIRYTDVNSLHAQRSVADGNLSRSYIQSEHADAGAILESFYSQSEQLPLRVFLPRDSDKALAFAALPDFDAEWFKETSLMGFIPDAAAIHLRTCTFRFSCDCSPEKLMPFFNSLSTAERDELYGEDKELIISCPRCGRVFAVEKAELDS